NAPNNKGNPQGNNCFTKNPIFIFAIFAIVMIIVFKGFFDGYGSLGGALNGTEVSNNVPYSELIILIESGQSNLVSIG
ncbi:cell division protein FtsH, partial [Campylobacter coli]|nr:cell division protein FtsH [Campylobacter coli]